MKPLTLEELAEGLIKLHKIPQAHPTLSYITLIAEDDDTFVVRWIPSGNIYIADKHDRTVAGYFYAEHKIP